MLIIKGRNSGVLTQWIFYEHFAGHEGIIGHL